MSKRQKRGGGDEEKETDEIMAFGGPMYDEATARKMLKEAVLASAEDAMDGEAVIGFDPDDAALDQIYGETECWETTSMIHSAYTGDAKMCRYLISRGASTTKMALSWPMREAAIGGHLEVCKLLYENGARDDIWKEDCTGFFPFHIAAMEGHDELLRWLVLHGGLCANANSGEIERDLIDGYDQMDTIASRSCEQLVEWAKEVTQTHSSLMMFLLGALPPAPDKDQSRTLQCLSGHPGVRKHIADFVGLEVTKAKQLRILQNVVEVLPSLIRTDDEE